MVKKQVLVLLLTLIFLSGCAANYIKQLSFKGDSENWEAVLNYKYIELFEPAQAGKVRHRILEERNYRINYTGKEKTLGEIEYQFLGDLGERLGSGEIDPGTVFPMSGTVRGESASEITRLQANNIVPHPAIGFPNTKSTFLLKITWDGKEESIRLTYQ